MPFACLAVLAAILAWREWVNHRTTSALLDRLMIKEGYEPIVQDLKEEAQKITKRMKTREEMLRNTVNFTMPGIHAGTNVSGK